MSDQNKLIEVEKVFFDSKREQPVLKLADGTTRVVLLMPTGNCWAEFWVTDEYLAEYERKQRAEQEAKTYQENPDGTWSRAVPYPLFVGLFLRKSQCQCGRKFKSQEAYEEHYRSEHTDGKRYRRTVTGMKEVI